ncbi:MAG: hypothetical protein EOO63_17120 [Hymenobacter sp.]|nr:MAG: hypothetical protein EOO63_17120 [Hymenobacter sp.]
MRKLFTCFLLGSSLLFATAAQAQATFSIGPQASLNVAGATNAATSTTTSTYRTGFEASIQSVVQFGHVAVQPLLRFSQKGLSEH